MSITAGTHRLGPENAALVLNTGRAGAAAKAGHDLVIDVTSWEATVAIGEAPDQISVGLSADATSLRVRAGTGGMKALTDDDKTSIRQTIDDDILKAQAIEFHSTRVERVDNGRRLSVQGDLRLVGEVRPIGCEVTVGEHGELSARATVKQTDWGIKPYSALFGALKVADEVEVVIEATLPSG